MIAVRHRTALLSTILAVATAVLALPSPASAALAGFQVRLSAPDAFKAGANPRPIEAVVSTDTARRCQKVRWSMLLRVADGVTFDDVKVTRIENGAEFPLLSQINGDTARLTDEQFDPGQLCRNSTVTARYDISFDANAPRGQIAYEVQALNANNVVLQQAAAASVVDGTGVATPTKTATPSPTPTDSGAGAGADPTASDDPTASADVTDTPSDSAAAPAATSTDGTQANAAASQGGVPSLLGPGLIIGALFVFIGVGILLRLRMRTKESKGHLPPTGFYPTR
jgi:hypothetical protein